eukprot:TRINITY_DN6897_c0_g1_i1.p1 TRINITY_DN6897_c0_g1~~TRINITY_DN6897_c0_g1_i1.p1  ORF type:complete len:345 (+),score=-22.95 TRINITY_DN6897_c0_g1_i1:506-1540(+)
MLRERQRSKGDRQTKINFGMNKQAIRIKTTNLQKKLARFLVSYCFSFFQGLQSSRSTCVFGYICMKKRALLEIRNEQKYLLLFLIACWHLFYHLIGIMSINYITDILQFARFFLASRCKRSIQHRCYLSFLFLFFYYLNKQSRFVKQNVIGCGILNKFRQQDRQLSFPNYQLPRKLIGNFSLCVLLGINISSIWQLSLKIVSNQNFRNNSIFIIVLQLSMINTNQQKKYDRLIYPYFKIISQQRKSLVLFFVLKKIYCKQMVIWKYISFLLLIFFNCHFQQFIYIYKNWFYFVVGKILWKISYLCFLEFCVCSGCGVNFEKNKPYVIFFKMVYLNDVKGLRSQG